MSWTCWRTTWIRSINLVALSVSNNTYVDSIYVVAWGMETSGSGMLGVISMKCLTWQCRGTHVGEEKMSSYSSTNFYIYFCRAGEPCFEDVATILFFSYGRILMKINFLVWEIILLHCFAVVKEMARGGTTSRILYNLFPKLITTKWGLDSYTTCYFHKYGWPNNTSDTSKGETSHSNSFMNDLMLYGRQHC